MVRAITALALCLAGSGYVEPRAAFAADGGGDCRGKVIDYVPYKARDGSRIGQLQLYWNAADGTNCAIMYHGGPTWGQASRTNVTLFVSSAGQAREIKRNEGNFRYQAGPIRTAGTGRCIAAAGGLTYKGSYYNNFTEYHCD